MQRVKTIWRQRAKNVLEVYLVGGQHVHMGAKGDQIAKGLHEQDQSGPVLGTRLGVSITPVSGIARPANACPANRYGVVR